MYFSGSCPPGTYLNASSRECIECGKGTFKSDINEEDCSQCPQGSTTLGSGSKNISDCIGRSTFTIEQIYEIMNQ